MSKEPIPYSWRNRITSRWPFRLLWFYYPVWMRLSKKEREWAKRNSASVVSLIQGADNG